ncbi:putative coil containing protein [Vibrio phage 277E43-1]|nr:putative coil containing protein [Vibrio phage 277E43-1]
MTYPNIERSFPNILRDCEILMSYPIGKLFTSDTPSGKEKKHEARCTKIVDSYYSIESKQHQVIRNLLHDIESTLLLFSDTITPRLLMESLGRLQAQFEAHKKTIDKACKAEKVLVDYYGVVQGYDEWYSQGAGFIVLSTAIISCTQDLTLYKGLYYDSYKDEKRTIKGEE